MYVFLMLCCVHICVVKTNVPIFNEVIVLEMRHDFVDDVTEYNCYKLQVRAGLHSFKKVVTFFILFAGPYRNSQRFTASKFTNMIINPS